MGRERRASVHRGDRFGRLGVGFAALPHPLPRGLLPGVPRARLGADAARLRGGAAAGEPRRRPLLGLDKRRGLLPALGVPVKRLYEIQ